MSSSTGTSSIFVSTYEQYFFGRQENRCSRRRCKLHIGPFIAKRKGEYAMRQRNCAGGVVFSGARVLLLQNDKGEWVLPKGVIRSGERAGEVALQRVKQEGGVTAKIIAPAGETCYEFFSVSRRAPISNKVDWFIMQADDEEYIINKGEGFQDGGFYSLDEAGDRITYSQDQSLVRLAFEKYLAFQEE